MPVVENFEYSQEVLQALRGSVPSGETIQYVAPFYLLKLNEVTNQFEIQNWVHAAVTESNICLLFLNWGWDLSSEQIQMKNDLESRQHKDVLSKGLKLFEKFGAIPAQSQRTYDDEQVLNKLRSVYGPLKWKWLPEVTSSISFPIGSVVCGSYSEGTPNLGIQSALTALMSEVGTCGAFEVSIGGHEWEIWGVFCREAFELYTQLRDHSLRNTSNPASANRMSKCPNCGSTELTARGFQIICDFCQSKFST